MDLGDKGEIRSDKGSGGSRGSGLDHLNYHSTNMSSDWRFSNTNLSNQTLGMVPTEDSVTIPKRDLMGSSASSMVDSFCPWEHPNSKNLGLCGNNVQTSTSTSSASVIRNGIPIRTGIDMGWDSPNLISRGGASFLQNSGGILPPSLSQFPTDSGFIERAARFSCFNGGNFADMVPFSISESLNPYSSEGGQMQGLPDGNLLKPLLRVASEKTELNMAEVSKDVSLSVEHGATEGSPMESERDKKRQLMSPNEGKHGIGLSNNESDDAEFSGGGGQEELAMMEGAGGEPSGAKGFGTKKRKKTGQDTDINQDKGASQGSHEAAKGEAKSKEKVDQNQTSGTSKGSGKFSKDGSVDAVKEDYIHVRARRGQATNSHSLAERVRREKISERMKFLQELVPGCSKVTGKAVMLDEIINYVQSLQRQVEFLSMKLATVNPRLDLNIEGLLAKDILQSQGGPSAMGFSPDMSMVHPQLHPSQQGLMQAGIPSLGNSSDTLRRTINSQLAAMSGYKDLTQAASVWDDEYHNIVQMSFGTNTLFNNQDFNGSLPSGHMKVEL